MLISKHDKGARRIVAVTARRTKVDFVQFVCRLLKGVYARARTVHVVLDNLNTHVRASFEEVLGHQAATVLLRRIEFHYTPLHASWPNSRSASWNASVWDGGSRTRPRSRAKWRRGSSDATPPIAASCGASLAKMLIGNWVGIMFRN